MFYRFMLLIGLICSLSTNHPAQLYAQKLTRIHIAVSANTVSWFPLYVGWKKGLFKEQSIEILPVQMSVRSALAGLASKQIPYITAIGSSMKAIAQEARENPSLLQTAPHNTPVRRCDEVKAARDLVLCCWMPE